MHDIGDMNFFSFLTFIGNHRFGSKVYFTGPSHGLKLWCGGSKEKVKILVWQLWQQQRKSKNIGMAAATPAIPVPTALLSKVNDFKRLKSCQILMS